jgi:hypothetical protein
MIGLLDNLSVNGDTVLPDPHGPNGVPGDFAIDRNLASLN